MGGFQCWAAGRLRGLQAGGATRLGARPSQLSKHVPPPAQECLQRFGDSLQEMVSYHMVSPGEACGGPASSSSSSHPRQPPKGSLQAPTQRGRLWAGSEMSWQGWPRFCSYSLGVCIPEMLQRPRRSCLGSWDGQGLRGSSKASGQGLLARQWKHCPG